jgi:hypothetical protein
VLTDKDGKFSFARVAPGDFSLFAWESVPMNGYRNAEWLQQMKFWYTNDRAGGNFGHKRTRFAEAIAPRRSCDIAKPVDIIPIAAERELTGLRCDWG